MNQELINEFKESLEKEKRTLTQELKSFAHPDKNVKGDWDANYQDIGNDEDENAQEVTEYATRLPLEHQLETRLRDVADALEKIKNNTYGICGKCGAAIDVGRLRAEPAARTCIQHN